MLFICLCVCCLLSPGQFGGGGSWFHRRGCCNPCCVPILMMILFFVFLGLCISDFENAATYNTTETCSVTNVGSISCVYSKTQYSCDSNHDGSYDEYCYAYTYGSEYQYTWDASCKSTTTKTSTSDCSLTSNSASYYVGETRTCYVNSGCTGISFTSPSSEITSGITYLVLALVFGGILVLSCWALYLIGSRGYGGYSSYWW